MTLERRLAVLLVSAVLLVPFASTDVGAAPARAAAATSKTFTWTVADSSTAQYRLTAAAIAVSPPDGLPDGCTASAGSASVDNAPPEHRATTSFDANCNGSYGLVASPTFERRTRSCLAGICGQWSSWSGYSGPGAAATTVDVGLPAPTVTGVAATPGDGHITVTWVDGRGDAPDLTGYRVLRRLSDDAKWDELGTVDADHNAFVDASLPPEGGNASYQVVATRNGGADATPSEVATTAFDGTSTGGDDGGGTTTPGGGSGGGTTTPGVGSDGNPSGGSSGVHHATTRRINGVAIRAPRLGMPSNVFFPPLLAPPTAADTGFDPDLPYDPETGPKDAVLPDDELSSSPLDQGPGRGLLIPVATALVLAVWAFHLRYLATASRPVYVDDFLEPYPD